MHSCHCIVASSGFDLTIRDSHFTILVEIFRNHILAENTYFTKNIEWTEHEIMVLKPANNYQIIWQCHDFKSILIYDLQAHLFLYQVKVLQTSLFTKLKMTSCKTRWFTIKIFIHHWFTQAPEKLLVKLCNACSLTKFQSISKFTTPSPRPSPFSYFFT